MYTIQMVSTTHCSLKVASLSQLGYGNSGHNVHSKDRARGEVPPITGLQLEGQPAFTFSQ